MHDMGELAWRQAATDDQPSSGAARSFRSLRNCSNCLKSSSVSASGAVAVTFGPSWFESAEHAGAARLRGVDGRAHAHVGLTEGELAVHHGHDHSEADFAVLGVECISSKREAVVGLNKTLRHFQAGALLQVAWKKRELGHTADGVVSQR